MNFVGFAVAAVAKTQILCAWRSWKLDVDLYYRWQTGRLARMTDHQALFHVYHLVNQTTRARLFFVCCRIYICISNITQRKKQKYCKIISKEESPRC